MEVWLLYGEDTESTADLAFEVRRLRSEGAKMDVDVKVFHPAQFELLVNAEERDSILIDGAPVPLPDFCYPYLSHGDRSYFSLSVIRQLERQGVRIYNNAACIESVADKLHTHQILAEHDLPTPVTMLAKFPVDMELIREHIGFPCVVKTLKGSNGAGVLLIENEKAFVDMMELIEETKADAEFIFQKYVAHSRGRDLRLFVVDGQVIACMERRAAGDSFKANFSAGGTVAKFEPDEAAVELSVRTADVLDIKIAGIDLLFTKDGGYTICEANTFPGFKGLEQACGVNVPEAIFTSMRKRYEEGMAEVA